MSKRRLTFGQDLARKTRPRVDNHGAALPTKVALRREALDAVGGPSAARVLDLFAGRGEMHRRVWHEAASYLGNDKDAAKALSHPALCHHTPAGVLLRSIDLAPWNVFDFDAYGSPWSEISVLFRRRRLSAGESIALVLTDGSPRRAMLGHTVGALARLAGVSTDAVGAHTRWAELGRAALERGARLMGGRLVRLRQSDGGPRGRGIWYAWALMQSD